MTAKQQRTKQRKQKESSSITVPPQLCWAEALDRRAAEVITGVLGDEETMAQIRDGIAELERGEPAIPWREVQAQAHRRHAGKDV